jgi:hypothetical protein
MIAMMDYVLIILFFSFFSFYVVCVCEAVTPELCTTMQYRGLSLLCCRSNSILFPVTHFVSDNYLILYISINKLLTLLLTSSSINLVAYLSFISFVLGSYVIDWP